MHHANHYYGHARVLARYCGSGDELPLIRGYLQHGWNIGDGMAPDHEYTPGMPSFLWSERTRRRAWSMGRRRLYVTGAPWAYLVAMTPPAPDQKREGTIFYPFHGWEGQHVQGDHDRLIAEIRDTETGPVTVCLYWQEYRTVAVRQRYEQAGFRVICHGYRGGWWKNLDPAFLDRQLAEQRRHRRVASNRLCSAILYGVLAGCEPAVYGDPMQLDGEKDLFGGRSRIRRQWAAMHGPTIDPATARTVTTEELGADRLLSPAELRHLLNWTPA
ncbi:hypothetical protein [Actinoplanes sp. G11-F43]|uniref:hypothetical protein n=1 Tax=Actinoplanes sp. G11-F43 TaxID=3424130 RepID=UPI003D355063